MSETNNDSFKAEMIAEIKRIQIELNELKDIKKSIEKKTASKKKAVNGKTAKKMIKRKTTKSK